MKCKQCQDHIVEAHYGDLDDAIRREFDEHVAACEECAALAGEVASTLAVMSRRRRVDPGEEFWDGYWARLDARLDESAAESDRTHTAWWKRRVLGGAGSRSSWAYRVAAAVLLIALGVAGDRMFVANSPDQLSSDEVATAPSDGQTPNDPATMRPEEMRTQLASANAMRYVGKTQMLLLALVNADPDEDGYASDMETQRKRSQALLAQAPALENALDDPKQRRLRELVGELEKILREIANLEAEDDVDAVELIRGSVNRNDVMLKINLEQMRYGSEEKPVQRDDV